MKMLLIATALFLAGCGGTSGGTDDATDEPTQKQDQLTGARIGSSTGQDVGVIQITPGAEVANDICGAYLSIPNNEVRPAGPSVQVSQVTPAMTLAIPLESGYLLTGWSNLVILFNSGDLWGIIPRSLLEVTGGEVNFSPTRAGTYQPALIPLEFAETSKEVNADPLPAWPEFQYDFTAECGIKEYFHESAVHGDAPEGTYSYTGMQAVNLPDEQYRLPTKSDLLCLAEHAEYFQYTPGHASGKMAWSTDEANAGQHWAVDMLTEESEAYDDSTSLWLIFVKPSG